MNLSIAFWILMLLALVFGLWSGSLRPTLPGSGNIILFFVLCLLGWKVFGAPLHG